MTLKVLTKKGSKEIDSLKLQQAVLDMLSAEAEIEVVTGRVLEGAVGVMLNQKNQEFGDKLEKLFAEYFEAVSTARNPNQAPAEPKITPNKNADYSEVKFVTTDGKVKKINIYVLDDALAQEMDKFQEKFLREFIRKTGLLDRPDKDMLGDKAFGLACRFDDNPQTDTSEILYSFIKEHSDGNLLALEISIENGINDIRQKKLTEIAKIKEKLNSKD